MVAATGWRGVPRTWRLPSSSDPRAPPAVMRRLEVPRDGSVRPTVTLSSTTGNSPVAVAVLRAVPPNAAQPLTADTSGPSAAHGPSASVLPS